MYFPKLNLNEISAEKAEMSFLEQKIENRNKKKWNKFKNSIK